MKAKLTKKSPTSKKVGTGRLVKKKYPKKSKGTKYA